ncbi:MAG: M24 family metallopeptidase [Acidimicrobiia bacterium]|nr:M24 family metallopeptidase [Acidimicrobiia bacterium]
MTDGDYPSFSDAEYQRRRLAVQNLMVEQGLDALVIFGWSAMGRAVQADVHYLSGYLGMRDNYVVFSANSEPVLFAQSYNHVPNASVVSVIETRWGGVDPGATIADELNRHGAQSVGVVGMMPYQHHQAMQGGLPNSHFVDITRPFRLLRVAKSPEELDWLRRGAEFTDRALLALERETVPGMHEYELAEVIEHSYLGDGGLTGFYYLTTTPMNAPESCVPAQVLSNRIIGVGDLMSCEISISYGGYAGQGLRTYTIDSEPTDQISDLAEVAAEVYRRVAAAIRPGATHEDVWDASSIIEESGYTIRDGLVHGFGIGLLPPSLRTRESSHEVEEWEFEENQTVVIQPNVITPNESVGVQMGDLCVVTPNGAQSLHGLPIELVRAG